MNPIDFFLMNGVDVFPIRPGTKQPDVPKGTSWKRWRGPRPTASYGVELGTLMVVDGDSAMSTAWIRAHCPATPFRVQTGPYHDQAHLGRGVHFYFRAPESPTPAFIHRDGLVIEARRAGQYVVGPGSVHPSGCTYRASAWSWRWEELPIFSADFQFDDGSRQTTLLGERYEVPDRVTAGERTAELFKFVRSLKARGASEEATWLLVQEFNQYRCDPPKPDWWLPRWFSRAWYQTDRPDFAQRTIAADSDVCGCVAEDDATPVIDGGLS